MKARIRYLAIFFLLILVFTLPGCGVPQKQYQDLQAQLASVQKNYEAATSNLSLMQAELDNTKTQVTSVQTQLASAQNESKQLQNEMDTQSTTLAEVQSQSMQFQDQLNGVLGTSLTQYYQGAFHAISYKWQLPVPLKSYFDYKAKPRPSDLSKLGAMVTDADANSVINVLIGQIKNMATTYDLKKSDVVNLVAKLIQNLPGTNNDVTTPYDNYPRYPIETLVDQGGDSQDTSILAAALLSRLEYNVVLFDFDTKKHMAIGVDMPGTGGYSWEFQAKRYYYLETTGDALILGDCPPEYRYIQPVIYAPGS